MSRNYSIDFFKFFAILSVVIIHTNPFSNTYVLGVNGSNIDFALDTFARFAVPFFFMTTGYLFGQKLKTTEVPFSYFKKFTLKIIKFYFCWQLFYLLYYLIFEALDGRLNDWLYSLTPRYWFDMFYYGLGSSGYHLWYLSSLIICLPIVYLFYCWNKIGFLLFSSFLLHIVGLFGQSYSGILDLHLQTRDAFFFGLFYITLGYYCAYNTKLVEVKFKPGVLLYSFFVFSFFQLIERFLLLNYFNGNYGDYFVSTIFATLCLFLFVINNSQLGKDSIYSKVGENSFGIYVIHVFFINVAYLLLNIIGIKFVSKFIAWHLFLTPLVFLISHYAYKGIQSAKETLMSKKLVSMLTRSL